MSDDLVRAEVNAVRALKLGVERYAEQIRDALRNARREVAAADRKAQEEVERRRSEVQKREHELRQVETALRRQCQENCGRLQQQVAAAAQRLAEAKQPLDRARKAAQLTATAQSELLQALQAIETTVGEHSSVASSALASLDAKLAELPKLASVTPYITWLLVPRSASRSLAQLWISARRWATHSKRSA